MSIPLLSCAAGKTDGCKILEIQRKILTNRRLSTRLSRINIDNFTFSSPEMIKGLYIQGLCPTSSGIVVFMEVGNRRDMQHADIAYEAGYNIYHRGGGYCGDSGEEVGIPELIEHTAWGFVLSQRREGINSDPAADWRATEGLQRNSIYGLIHGSTKTTDTVFSVMPHSGLTGNMPVGFRDRFLKTLARSISPHFSLLCAPPRDSNKTAWEIIQLPVEEVIAPTCLRWPSEEMLVHQLMQSGEDVRTRYLEYGFAIAEN